MFSIFVSVNELLKFIYENEKIQKSAKNIAGGREYWVDLLSELILSLSKMDLTRLSAMKDSGELIPFCYKTMYYKHNNPYESFYKNYRVFESISVETIEYKDEAEEDIYEQVLIAINKVEFRISRERYPTECKLLEAYIEHGTFRKTAEKTGINFNTIQQCVTRVIKEIKKEYDISNNK